MFCYELIDSIAWTFLHYRSLYIYMWVDIISNISIHWLISIIYTHLTFDQKHFIYVFRNEIDYLQYLYKNERIRTIARRFKKKEEYQILMNDVFHSYENSLLHFGIDEARLNENFKWNFALLQCHLTSLAASQYFDARVPTIWCYRFEFVAADDVFINIIELEWKPFFMFY